ncbi:hypothetical protein VF21_07380 [Pseudogymnoascus sp. 05NY08]|nr:hypothetical protein VF21_07380 [Pseudogymnoascus sp. 05NY08]
MEYQCRPAEKFGLNPAFKSAVLMFQMPKSVLEEFDAIASSVAPPHDPRVLMERNPEPPARDCGAWVTEVLDRVETLLRDKGDIEMGDLYGSMDIPWISLDQNLLADLDVLVIPKAKTLSTIMNEHFPDALAISFVSHQILIELIEITFDEHCGRLANLPGGFWDTNLNTDRFRDKYGGTDYLKSQGCFQPGSMMSFGENRIFSAGIQVKRQHDIRMTVPTSFWDKKLEPEVRLGTHTVKQGDWENGTAFGISTKRILQSGTRVAKTYKPFNNRFLNLKCSATSLLHSDDIKKVSELFCTDNFVTGPQQLASVGKRICKVDMQGNDFFSDPDTLPVPGKYGELVQCIYATSMPPINSQQKIQNGVCGAPIIRARKEENCPLAVPKYSAPKTRSSEKRRPSHDTPITVLQKQLPQEETTGEVAGFMDIQYGGDRLLCFADVVDGLVDDGWSVVPVDTKRKVNEGGVNGDAGLSIAIRSRNE